MSDERVASMDDASSPEQRGSVSEFQDALAEPGIPAVDDAPAATWDVPPDVAPSSEPLGTIPSSIPDATDGQTAMSDERVASMNDASSPEQRGSVSEFQDALAEPGIPAVDDAPAATWDVPPDVAPKSEPVGAIPSPLPDAGRPGDETCVFLGPAGAGKTCLLAAMNAACYAETATPDLGLSIACDGDAYDQLLEDRVSWIGRGIAPQATHTETVYPLELSARTRSTLLGRTRLEVKQLRCVDAPGRQYFPPPRDRGGPVLDSPITPRQIHQLAMANTLVMVVDATRPRIAAIETNLPKLLDRIATSLSGEPLRQSGAAHILSRLGLVRSYATPRRTRVRAARVLLVLTKIDVLASAIARQLAAFGEPTRAVDIAWAIDPIGLAIEVLGERTLRQLRRSIGADADFAVSLCSASGFCEGNGHAFACGERGRTSDERLNAWVPFGIGEMLQYIMLGRCTRTVQRVTEAEIRGGEKLAIAGYPFQEVR